MAAKKFTYLVANSRLEKLSDLLEVIKLVNNRERRILFLQDWVSFHERK